MRLLRRYNAHSTGANSLWAGVPLLTLAGEKMAARVAAGAAAAPDRAPRANAGARLRDAVCPIITG